MIDPSLYINRTKTRLIVGHLNARRFQPFRTERAFTSSPVLNTQLSPCALQGICHPSYPFSLVNLIFEFSINLLVLIYTGQWENGIALRSIRGRAGLNRGTVIGDIWREKEEGCRKTEQQNGECS